MIQQTSNSRNIANLEKEVELLRSFVIGIAGKDKEGEYRPEFVKRILEVSQATPARVFTDRNSLLSYLRKSSA